MAIPAAPVLGDQAYGDNTVLRERLHDVEREYVLAVGPASKVFAPETVFSIPARTAATELSFGIMDYLLRTSRK